MQRSSDSKCEERMREVIDEEERGDERKLAVRKRDRGETDEEGENKWSVRKQRVRFQS